MLVIMRVGRGALRATALGLSVLIALSISVSVYGWHHGWGVDRLYFGTDVAPPSCWSVGSSGCGGCTSSKKVARAC